VVDDDVADELSRPADHFSGPATGVIAALDLSVMSSVSELSPRRDVPVPSVVRRFLAESPPPSIPPLRRERHDECQRTTGNPRSEDAAPVRSSSARSASRGRKREGPGVDAIDGHRAGGAVRSVFRRSLDLSTGEGRVTGAARGRFAISPSGRVIRTAGREMPPAPPRTLYTVLLEEFMDTGKGGGGKR
jgi:hypothetical protein